MAKTYRTRRTTVPAHTVEASPCWGSSQLKVASWKPGGNERIEAVIVIEHPYQLRAIRAKLDSIEHYWSESIARCKP